MHYVVLQDKIEEKSEPSTSLLLPDPKPLGSDITTTATVEQNCFVECRNSSNTATTKEESIEIEIKADNNNNKKLSSNVDVNTLKLPRATPVLQKSLSLESFEECEKTLVDEETGSEWSNDFRQIEDAISWLEVHEKSNQDDDSLTKTSDNNSHNSQTALFPSDFNNIVVRTHNAISEVTKSDSIVIESPLLTKNTLPVDKKTALLQALEAIDLGLKEKSPSLPKPVAINRLSPGKNSIRLKKKVN